ncbi:MAG: phosphatidate cytidylyltransferase [Anaerolineales bacterium]|nr:MAG: phosphatidate cytidylyltransferase [Anaerolineales bacterium]
MFVQRLIVTLIIVPLAVLAIFLGGYVYQAVIILMLVAAAWEYCKLAGKVNLEPSLPLVLGGVILLVVSRVFFQFSYNSVIITVLLFGTSAFHILQYEQKESKPTADFGATVSIFMYIGFLGAYLISLRDLPGGMWWTFLVLPTVWIADSGAYLVGSTIGKHKLAAKTSPNKTWEGYFAGILTGILGCLGLIALFNQGFDAGLTISTLEGTLLGLAVSALIPLGDLTESMIKRQAGEKDSGTIFPGHGGIFDRLDSLFWAAPIGYYLILHFFL